MSPSLLRRPNAVGHAGAIIAQGKGTAKSKIEAFKTADVKQAQFPTDITDLVEQHS